MENSLSRCPQDVLKMDAPTAYAAAFTTMDQKKNDDFAAKVMRKRINREAVAELLQKRGKKVMKN